MRGRVSDLTGQRFGRLVVIERAFDRPNDPHARWKCHCDCGADVIVFGSSLSGHDTKSCGCLAREVRRNNMRKLVTKHGLYHEPEARRLLRIWSSMKQRCYNPNNKAYRYYGGKGVTVCDEWRTDFRAFYDWAYAHGYKGGLSIDRINSKKDYCPSNCQWLTLAENAYKAVHARLAAHA